MRKPKNYDEKILQCLKGNPSTYEELGSGIGLPFSASVRNYARNLLMNDKVREVTVRRCWNIAGRRSIFYLPGEEKFLGEKVKSLLPSEVKSERIKRRINRALKDSLPKEVFDIVRFYVHLSEK